MPPLEVVRQFAAHDFSIARFFQVRCEQLGDRPMVEYQDQVMSWRECAHRVDRAVGWLRLPGARIGHEVVVGSITLRVPELLTLGDGASREAWRAAQSVQARGDNACGCWTPLPRDSRGVCERW